MSDIASKLNGLVLILVAIAAFVLFSQRLKIGPPDDAWFQAEVINRPEPVLVKCGASWCGPCRMLEGELDKFASQTDGRVAVVRVDVDKHPNLAQHYRVSSIPRLLLFQQGQIVGDRVGYADHQQLESWVLAHAATMASPKTVTPSSLQPARQASASFR
jgi:thioredoxin